MPIVQSTTGSNASGVGLSATLNGVAAGNGLVLVLAASAMATDTVPLDTAGDVWTKINYLNHAGAGAAVAAYWRQSASAGSHTVTWPPGLNAFTDYALIEVTPRTGVDQAGTESDGAGAITTLAANGITSANPSIAIAVMAINGNPGLANAAITTPAGFTPVLNQSATNAFAGAQISYKDTTGGAQAASWGFSADGASASYACTLFSLTGPAAGGGTGQTKKSGTLNRRLARSRTHTQ